VSEIASHLARRWKAVSSSCWQRGQSGSDLTFIKVKCQLRSAWPVNRPIRLRRSFLDNRRVYVERLRSTPLNIDLACVHLSVELHSWHCGHTEHFLAGIDSCSSTDSAAYFDSSVVCQSVCPSVVCRLLVCYIYHPLLRMFNKFRCHLAGRTLVGSNRTLCWMRSLTPRGKWDLRVKLRVKTCNCKLAKTTKEWFCHLPNHFSVCF